jgi:hypothetical protein
MKEDGRGPLAVPHQESLYMLQSLRPRCALLIRCLGAAFVITLASTAARAADGDVPPGQPILDPITDLFYLEPTYFQAKVRTVLRIDPQSQPFGGTQLSAENDLGLPSSNPLGSVQLMVRMRERNRLRVDYFQLDRMATMLINRNIIFGNQVFVAGSDVQTTLNLKLMGFTYTRAIVQTSSFELGAGLGVHMIQADAIGEVPAFFQRHETSVAGAFPTIAVDTIWRISRRFAFTGRANYFGTAVQGFAGSLGNYHGDLQYRWTSNFALCVGYEYWRIGAESRTNGNPGRVVLAAQGPEAFVRVSF